MSRRIDPLRSKCRNEASQAGEGRAVPRQRKRDEGGILDDYFNRRTLAKYLDVAAGTIANWQQADKGPPIIVLGGQILYRKTDVTKWLDQQHSMDRTVSTRTQAKQASVDLHEPQQPIYWPTELVRAIETAAAEAGQSAPDFLCAYLSTCFLTPATPATNGQPMQVPRALKRLTLQARVSKQLSLNVIAKLSRVLLGEPTTTPCEDGVGGYLDYPHALVPPDDTYGEWNAFWKKQLAAAQENEEPPGDE
jgi:hypothetical protein